MNAEDVLAGAKQLRDERAVGALTTVAGEVFSGKIRDAATLLARADELGVDLDAVGPALETVRTRRRMIDYAKRTPQSRLHTLRMLVPDRLTLVEAADREWQKLNRRLIEAEQLGKAPEASRAGWLRGYEEKLQTAIAHDERHGWSYVDGTKSEPHETNRAQANLDAFRQKMADLARIDELRAEEAAARERVDQLRDRLFDAIDAEEPVAA